MGNSVERNYKVTMDKSDFDTKAKGLLGLFKKIDSDGSKLKNMDTSGSVKGIGRIQSAIRGLNFASASDGMDALTANVSRSGAIMNGIFTGIGIQIANLGTRAVQSGLKIADALTFKGARDGFHEYELNMDSIQTILANAPGETTKSVNAALDELNTYADQTVYKFSDMTYAIGRFTSAGNDLKKSVTAVKGLSNYAASVGADPSVMKNAYTQIAQALSSGHFQAQDWMSVQNANLDSMLLKKKLVDKAIAQGNLSESDRDSVMNNFRGSLMEKGTKGWLTADNFMSAIQEFADDPTMQDAATKVRTFSKLIDTLQEAVGSTWTSTWRTILGDFDEATELFTGISNTVSGIISAMNDKRNALLKGWLTDLGGRKDMIDGFKEIWRIVSQIAEIIGTAFRRVFPEKTAAELKEMSTAFLNWSKNLQLSGNNVDRLSNAFEGFFRIIKSIRSVVGFVTKAFFDMIPFRGIMELLLSIGGAFGKVINSIRTGFARTMNASGGLGSSVNVFKKIGTALSNVLVWVADRITMFVDRYSWFFERIGSISAKIVIHFKEFYDKFVEVFKGLLAFLKPYVQNVIDFISPLFKGLSKVFNENMTAENFDAFLSGVADAIGNFWGFLKGLGGGGWDILVKIGNFLAPLFSKFSESAGKVNVLEAVGNGLKKAGHALGEGFKSMQDSMNSTNIGKAFNLLIAALITAWAYKMFRAAQKVKAVTDQINSLADAIKKPFISLGKSITEVGKAMAMNLKASAFLQFAGGIGLLSLALYIMSRIPVADALPNAIMLGGLVVVIGYVFKGLMEVSEKANPKSILALAAISLSIGFAVKSMSKAIKELAGVAKEGVLGKATITVLSLITFLTAANYVASKTKHASKGFISIAAAVILMTLPIKMLGQMDPNVLSQGRGNVNGIMVMMGLLHAVFALSRRLSKGADPGSSALKLAAGITLLVIPIKLLGEMDPGVLRRGFVTVGGLMALLTLSNVLMQYVEKTGKVQIGPILALSTGVVLLGGVVALLGLIPPENVITAGIVVAGLLAMVSLAVKMLDAVKVKPSALAGIAIMGIALNLMTIPLGILSLMKPDKLLVAAIALIGVVTALTIALKVANSLVFSVAAAASIVLLAGALALLAPAMKMLGDLKISQLLMAAAALAAIAGAIGLLGFLAGLPPVAAGLLVLAGAISVTAGAIGLGALAFGLGVSMIVNSITGLIKALTDAGKQSGKLGENIVKALNSLHEHSGEITDGLSRMFDDVANSAPQLTGKFANMLGSIIGGAIASLPALMIGLISGFGKAIGPAMQSILPEISLGLAKLTVGIVRGLFEMGAAIMRILANVILGPIRDALGAIPFIGDSLKAGVQAGIDGLNGLADNTSKAGEDIGKGLVGGFIKAMHENTPVEAVSKELRKISDLKITDDGYQLMTQLADGFLKGTENFKEISEAIKTKLSEAMKKGASYNDGVEIVYELVRGFVAAGKLTEDQAADMMHRWWNNLKNQDFKGLGNQKGKEVAEGTKDGFLSSGLNINDMLSKGLGQNGKIDLSAFKEDLKGQMPGISEETIQALTDSYNKGEISLDEFQAKLKAEMEKPAEAAKDAGKKANSEYASGVSESTAAQEASYEASKKAWEETQKSEAAKEAGSNDAQKYTDGIYSSTLTGSNLSGTLVKNWENASQASEKAANSAGVRSIGEFASGISSGADTSAGAANAASKAVGTELNLSVGYGRDAGSNAASAFLRGLAPAEPGASDIGTRSAGAAYRGFDSQSAYGPGSALGSSFVSGINSWYSTSNSSAYDVGSTAYYGLDRGSSGTYSIGVYFGQGFVNGINSEREAASKAAAAMGDIALGAIALAGWVRSPSRKMMRIGSYYGEGFVIGMNKWNEAANDAGTQLGETVLNATDMLTGLNDQQVLTPKVKPIMDLSEVNKWKPSDYAASVGVEAAVNATKTQNGGEMPSNTINITVNGNADQSSIREIAMRVDQVLKNAAESMQMSKGMLRAW